MSIPSTGALIRAYRLPAFTTAATPVAAHGISWRPEKNGPGSASFSIPMDDPAYGNIDVNDMVAIRPNGTTVAVLLVEEIREHTLDVEGGARQVATYVGRLAGSQLEWGIVAPALGDLAEPVEDDTVLDWRSPRYDPVAYGDLWVPSTEIMTVADATAGDWPHQPMGESFDLSTGAMMICDASGTDTLADEFWRLFYRDITITTPGRYGTEVLMDDLGMFWVDGIQQLDVAAEDGFVRASFKRLDLSAGTHRFCWAVYNYEDPANPGQGLGPSALAYNLYKADLQDRPLAGGDSWISDANTNVLYVGTSDNFPGMTVGDDLVQFVEEARDGTVEAERGCFPWLVCDFDRDLDSNGDPFDRVSITTKTQTTNYLQFLDELVAAGRISRWRVLRDGVTLQVFAPGYASRPTFAGYPTGYELEPAPVNDPRTGQLTQLDRRIT